MTASANIVRRVPRSARDWPEQRVAQLRALWAAGESASAVAGKLRCGVPTIHRVVADLGLTRASITRSANAQAQGVVMKARHRKVITGTGAVMDATTHSAELAVRRRDVPATAKTIVDLAADECRMPVGDLMADHGHATLFCGARTLKDRVLPNGQVGFQSYCPCHLREATKLLPGGVRPSEKQLRRELRRVI